MDTNKYYIELGKRLVKIREQKKLTQKNIAQTLGVSFQQYQKYESGANRIPTKSLVLFCNLTNCDIREVTGLPKKDYEELYKRAIVHNNYNTTYVNNFNGLFTNLFNMDLKPMKNKISVFFIIFSLIIYFGVQLLKFSTNINSMYNSTFLSIQLLGFVIAFTAIVFIVFSYNILSYLLAFISYVGIYATIYRFIFLKSASGIDRLIMYVVAVVLCFVTFYLLMKFNINTRQEETLEKN